MTPESLNSSLLENGGKQVQAEMYMHGKNIRITVSMQRRGKHTSVRIEKLLGNGVSLGSFPRLHNEK
jgi:hypothetical protein